MPYEVIADGAIDVLKSYGEAVDPYSGQTVAIEHGSNVYLPGDIIADDDVSPVVKEQYENGDEHVRSLLRKVSEKASEKVSEKPKATRRNTAKKEQVSETEEGE